MRRKLILVTAVAVLAAAALLSREADAPPPAPYVAGRDRVARVVDGDTVVLARGGNARLIGVDTPEVFGRSECFGRRASAFVRRRVAGRAVRVRVGVEPRDRYGRLLVYLFLGERMVNAELVRVGVATPLAIAPNVRYAARFERLAAGARRAGSGLWSACAS